MTWDDGSEAATPSDVRGLRLGLQSGSLAFKSAITCDDDDNHIVQ